MTAAERVFRPNAVDQTTISTSRPALHAFVRALAAHERFTAFAAALPARARVSEPALPLLLATLHDQLARPLVCVLPEDADARDAADAAGWFLGAEQVALLPSRGVHRGSGLEPPPHLVGERARALHVLAAGGLVCASAAALAEGLPPPGERGPSRSASPSATSRAWKGSPRAGARRLRARRAGRRARPVRRARRARRRLPHDGSRAAPRRVLRGRDRTGARLLTIHAARAAPGRRRARPSGFRASADLAEPPWPQRMGGRTSALRLRATRSFRPSTALRTSSGSRTRSAASGRRRGSSPSTSPAPPSSIRSRTASPSPSRRSGRRSPPAG